MNELLFNRKTAGNKSCKIPHFRCEMQSNLSQGSNIRIDLNVQSVDYCGDWLAMAGLRRDCFNYISLFLTMSHCYQEPDHSEQEPRKEKRGGETENGPVPGSSNH